MTRLTKAVTRLVDVEGHPYAVTLGRDGISFRLYRSRSPLLLPYRSAIVKAAMLKGDAELEARGEVRRRRPIKRGSRV